MLGYLLRTATAEAVRSRMRGLDFAPLIQALDGTTTVSTGEQVTAAEFLAGLPDLGDSDLYDQIAARLGAENEGTRASAVGPSQPRTSRRPSADTPVAITTARDTTRPPTRALQ